MSFQEVYENWKIYAQKRHKKQGFETLLRNFNLHILPYFKERNVSDLDKSDIVDWQTKILEKNFSNSFNNSLYYTFSDFIKYCILFNYMEYNIVTSIDKFPKRIEIKKHNVYNIFQFRKFRFSLSDYVIKQYFNFMFFYGTRPSEAMALKFTDINGFYVNIIHSIHRRGNRELDTPKNVSSVRTIKISLLMRFRFYRLKKYYFKKYGCVSDYFIFGGLKPLSTTTVDRYKRNACIKAHLFEITQHEFRHSYATRKIHHKVPIDKVSRSMGHSKVSTTVDIYLHQEKRVSNTPFVRFSISNTTQKF